MTRLCLKSISASGAQGDVMIGELMEVFRGFQGLRLSINKSGYLIYVYMGFIFLELENTRMFQFTFAYNYRLTF